MISASGERVCPKCGNTGPFYKNKGHTSWCVACHGAYRQAHRAKALATTKAWKKANIDLYKAQNKHNKVRRKGATGFLTAQQWAEVLDYFCYLCAYCLSPLGEDVTQDHVIPISKGGQHTQDNVVPAHHSCNSKKSAKPMWAMGATLVYEAPLHTNRTSTQGQEHNLYQEYIQGRTLEVLALQYRCSVSTVRRALFKQQTRMRPKGRARSSAYQGHPPTRSEF